ncbi:MAG: alpha/beta hydrolase [Chryseolinea sp.]
MKDIYLFSGLGADWRVFEYLKLDGVRLNHVKWITPHRNETIGSYALRLSTNIKTPNPILIGVSFGGMMAIEIAKIMATEKVIIISSAKSSRYIPSLNSFARLKLHTYIPVSFLKYPNEAMYWFFGARTRDEKNLLRSIIKYSDASFIPWALDQVLNWSNTIESENVVSIHGTNDRLIPFTKADFVIPNGGHLMILSHHQEVSDIIKKVLNL